MQKTLQIFYFSFMCLFVSAFLSDFIPANITEKPSIGFFKKLEFKLLKGNKIKQFKALRRLFKMYSSQPLKALLFAADTQVNMMIVP